MPQPKDSAGNAVEQELQNIPQIQNSEKIRTGHPTVPTVPDNSRALPDILATPSQILNENGLSPVQTPAAGNSSRVSENQLTRPRQFSTIPDITNSIHYLPISSNQIPSDLGPTLPAISEFLSLNLEFAGLANFGAQPQFASANSIQTKLPCSSNQFPSGLVQRILRSWNLCPSTRTLRPRQFWRTVPIYQRLFHPNPNTIRGPNGLRRALTCPFHRIAPPSSRKQFNYGAQLPHRRLHTHSVLCQDSEAETVRYNRLNFYSLNESDHSLAPQQC